MNTVDKGGKCARNYLFFIGGGHAFLTSLVAVGYALTYEPVRHKDFAVVVIVLYN